ncbi:MAG: PilN domain-containing protein [Magnetococcales bacterium]|nr:PilN domain-containing protein [Magnetococcales bacterium]
MILKVNLLPYREARREKMIQTIFIAWGITALVGLGLIMFAKSSISSHIDSQIVTVSNQNKVIATLDAKLGEIKDINIRKKQVKARLVIIETLGLQRDLPVHLFEVISSSIPEKVWLKEISTKGNNLTIIGFTLSNAMVADFMRKLDSSIHISQVNLNNLAKVNIDKSNRKLREFKLSATIVVPAPKETDNKKKRGGK